MVKPAKTSTGIPGGRVLEEYYDLIVDGAAYRLLRMPNKAWTNGRAAAEHKRQYEDGLSRAKSRSTATQLGRPSPVRYGGIPFRGAYVTDSYAHAAQFYGKGIQMVMPDFVCGA